MTDIRTTAAMGQNAWLVDEMYERYLADPHSVSASWQDFFADYGNDKSDVITGARARLAAPAPASAAPAPTAPAHLGTAPPPTAPASFAPAPTAAGGMPLEAGEVIRGASARIVANMQASLQVPTATSFREVPARLLEVNRSLINNYLQRIRGGKISFTHIIGYAVVRAVADAMPVMNSSFYADSAGQPRVIRHQNVNLGIAVDVQKADHSHSLLVPSIKTADTLDFQGFVDSYEELIRKVRSNKLSPDDMAGTTVTLTNPGTVGTVQSVPRLMPGQGVIVGVGTIDYPTAFRAADPAALAEMGVSKTVTLTSTYDHRIIQGAESGLFLQKVHELLLGEDDFYVDVFRSLGVPYEAVKWRKDTNPSDREQVLLEKQLQVHTLINTYRVRGHLIADLDPLAWKEPKTHPELDPAYYGLTIWDLDREFLTGGLGGLHANLGEQRRMRLEEILKVLRDAYCSTIGIEYMHIQNPAEKEWIQQQVEGNARAIDKAEQDHILDRLNAAEALEKFLATKYLGQKRFGIEGAEAAIPILDKLLNEAADSGLDSAFIGMAHRGAPQRVGEHRWQELRPALRRVRGQHLTRLHSGFGRRQVPPRTVGQIRKPCRQRHPGRTRRQPVAPRSRQPSGGRHGPRPNGSDRAELVVIRCYRS